jgi:hypothetical protein
MSQLFIILQFNSTKINNKKRLIKQFIDNDEEQLQY